MTGSALRFCSVHKGKGAKADCYKADRYGREVCTVYVNGQDIGVAQLDAGLAWWYRKYAHEQPPKERVDYESAEDRAERPIGSDYGRTRTQCHGGSGVKNHR